MRWMDAVLAIGPTINVVSLRWVSILPPLGNRTDFAGCLQWNEPEVNGHVTMDAVGGSFKTGNRSEIEGIARA